MGADGKQRQRALILGTGLSALGAARALRLHGIGIVAAWWEEEADAPLRWLADDNICVGVRCHPAASMARHAEYARLFALAARMDCRFVFPADPDDARDPAIASAAEVADLVFLGANAETLAMMDDRAAFRRFAMRLGFALPNGPFEPFDVQGHAYSAGRAMRFPIRVRPARVCEGAGVLVREAGDLNLALERIFRQSSAVVMEEQSDPWAQRVDIPAFVDRNGLARAGPEISASPLLGGVHAPFFESPAPQLARELADEMQRCAEELMRALDGAGYMCVRFHVAADQSGFWLAGLVPGPGPADHLVALRGGPELAVALYRQANGQTIPEEDLLAASAANPAMTALIHAAPSSGARPAGRILSWPAPADGRRGASLIDTDLFPGRSAPNELREEALIRVSTIDRQRKDALGRLRRAVKRLELSGIATTQEKVLAFLNRSELDSGNYHATTWSI